MRPSVRSGLSVFDAPSRHPLLGILEPASAYGDEAKEWHRFLGGYRRWSSRMTAFANLGIGKLDLATLTRKLSEFEGLEGAAEKPHGHSAA